MPSAILYLAILVLNAGIVPALAYVYDEAGSVSLIEKIDRYHRSTGEEFYEELEHLDEHGHTGHEEDLSGALRFTNEWVVKISGGPSAAAALAEEMGYEIIGEVNS